MSATWVVGDIHGCAEELAELLERLGLGEDDRLVALGDLYHRGPDPLGVARLLTPLSGLRLVLGNHEHVLLQRMRRFGATGPDADLSGIPAEDLRGDGGTRMAPFDPARSGELLSLLTQGAYFRRGRVGEQDWIAVHAGVIPGRPVEDTPVEQLVHLRRFDRLPGRPYWYEVHHGPELVLFGHTSSPLPRMQHAGGRLVALGLDTGCVYGGSLSAYRLEDGEFESVPARRRYVG